jgi:hypothetical protein
VGVTSRPAASRAAVLAGLIAVVIAGCGSSSASTKRSPSASTPSTSSTLPTTSNSVQRGPEGVPLEPGQPLASAATTTPGTTVDGIECAPVEQLAYHIHAHLQVYADGQPRSLPGAIGLVGPVAQQTPVGPFYGAQQCYYWLHTHASDGVIHIESPTQRVYTLGDFFDEWRQPLSPDQVAGAKGTVTAFVDGRRWTKSPRAIPLLPHAAIQLDVGSPVTAFQPISWAGTVL